MNKGPFFGENERIMNVLEKGAGSAHAQQPCIVIAGPVSPGKPRRRLACRGDSALRSAQYRPRRPSFPSRPPAVPLYLQS